MRVAGEQDEKARFVVMNEVRSERWLESPINFENQYNMEKSISHSDSLLYDICCCNEILLFLIFPKALC